MTLHPSQEACRAAAAAIIEARRHRDSVPVAEAARLAHRAGGPSLPELEARIAARRAANRRDPQAVAA